IIDEHTTKLFGRITIPPDVAAWLLAEITHPSDEEATQARRAALQRRHDELRRLRTRAYEDKLLGRITDEFWTERAGAWQTEIDEIQGALDALATTPTAEALAAARRPIELLQTAHHQW